MKLVLTTEAPAPLASAISVGRVVAGTRQPTKAWIRDFVSTTAPAGTRIEVVDIQGTASSRDWPVFLVQADVVSADGAITEARLIAVYIILQFAAAVTLRCAKQDLEQARASALPAMLSGRPDSSDDVVCVQDLFQ